MVTMLNRDVIVPVRLTTEEVARLDEARTPKGLSRSAYLRMVWLENEKHPQKK